MVGGNWFFTPLPMCAHYALEYKRASGTVLMVYYGKRKALGEIHSLHGGRGNRRRAIYNGRFESILGLACRRLPFPLYLR